ncbi:hypothetical protein GMSM_28160 [Geomonas sp. Red276]
MGKKFAVRALRSYRNMSPTRFHGFNQKVSRSLPDNPAIPGSLWASNPTLVSLYLELTRKYEVTYHGALDGSKLLIAQRGALQAELVDYLDEILSTLEAAAVRNPDVLVASGFDLAKERRGRTRAKIPSQVSDSDKEVTNADFQQN